MTPKLRLVDDAEKRNKLRKAAESRAEASDMGAAWRSIFSMKNTALDERRLREVYTSMQAGEIERDPADAYNKRGQLKKFSKAEALRLWAKLQERKKKAKLRELVESTPDNYRLITTREALQEVVNDITADESAIAVDTETTGLDVYSDHIVGISLTLPRNNYHVYIPVAHDEGEQLDRDYVLSELKPVFEENSIGKVLHNAKYDMHMLMRYNIRLRGLKHDTQVAMHILNENEPSKRLKDLATKYLDEPSDTYDDLFGKAPFNTVPLDVALVYAAKDTDLTWRLYEFQLKHFERLPKLKRLYYEIEHPVIDVSFEMERAGFVLDLDYAAKLKKELTEELAEIEKGLRNAFGDINFNSPKQLSEKLFGDLRLDRYLPKNFKLSTDVRTLKLLQNKHEGVDLLLQYREKTKLLSTYVDALPQQIKPDGRIHGNFRQDATVTGRFASSDPNLQNQPYYVRKLFVPPEGYVLLSGDYSQQEPRLLAHFTGEETLVNAYREGKDLYTTAAAELFGKPESECGDGSKWRKMMKTGILAVMYGTGPSTLADQLGITKEEAIEFIEGFYAKYPKVKAWVDNNVKFARKYGYVETLFGRKRRLPEIKSREKWERLRAERQCTNARIQGSAADMTKMAMVKLSELCKRKGWKMALQVHDEIAVYAKEDLTPEDVEEFEQTMLNAVKLIVPNKSDVEIAKRWGEGKPPEEWFKEHGL